MKIYLFKHSRSLSGFGDGFKLVFDSTVTTEISSIDIFFLLILGTGIFDSLCFFNNCFFAGFSAA